MDSIRNNFNNVPEIVPNPSNAPQSANTPSKLDAFKRRLQVWWAKLRYSRKPQLSPTQLKSRSWLKYVKDYWWAAAIVVAAVVAGVGWWYLGVQREEKWEQATDYYRRADYKNAAPLLLEMSLPDDAEQLRIYGQTMQATNHSDKAIEAYKKLYEKEKDPFAKLSLGNVYNQQQNYEEAVKAYQSLIADNPNYIQAYVNLSTVYRLQGKNSDAIDIGKKGLQNNANSVALAELVVSLTADNPESDEHKQALETLKRINPEDPLLQQ